MRFHGEIRPAGYAIVFDVCRSRVCVNHVCSYITACSGPGPPCGGLAGIRVRGHKNRGIKDMVFFTPFPSGTSLGEPMKQLPIISMALMICILLCIGIGAYSSVQDQAVCCLWHCCVQSRGKPNLLFHVTGPASNILRALM